MAGAVPGYVVEVDGLLVVLVTVATELERSERRVDTDMIADDMVKRSIQGPSGRFDRKRGCATEKAGSALGVDIGSILKFSIQAGDKSYFVFDRFQGTQGRR